MGSRVANLVDFFPHLGEALAVDAEVPLAEITKGREPDLIARFAQPLGDGDHQRFGKLRRRGVATEVGK